jgi:GNAT superfamily N-acetyltransferase
VEFAQQLYCFRMKSDNIRKATDADIPAMMHIRSAVRENKLSSPDKVTFQHYVDFIRTGEMWVWEEDNRLLGFSAGDARADSKWPGSIWALFVDPEHEGKGIGQALLSRACGSLERAGYDTAKLSTAPASRAARFYNRAGWSEDGHTDDGQIIFKRPLPAPAL